MRNKIFTRIIITTLFVTFLTFSVGRVTRVSAVGTTAAIAGTAFIATGLIYMSYLALTGAEIRMPLQQDLREYLHDVGKKVAQYPSGSKTYQEMYQYYAVQRDPLAVVIDGVWTWTEDKLKDFINDFSNTYIASDIIGYSDIVDVSSLPTNGFDYSQTIVSVPLTVFDGSRFWDLSRLSMLWKYTGSMVLYVSSQTGMATLLPSNQTGTLRNYYESGLYTPQKLVNGVWTNINNLHFGYGKFDSVNYVNPDGSLDYYVYTTNEFGYNSFVSLSYPLFANEQIYDAENDEYLPLVVPDANRTFLPSWNDPDNDNRPIVPWVPIPDLPSNITPPSGYNNIDQWGFNIEDLLDILEDLGETIFDLSVLKELINDFAGLHGDQYYLYYDDGDDNYYYLYQPTNYYGDYVTYNIDISQQEDIIPVDLNTIQLYTDNQYVESIKSHAQSFGDMLGEYVVFWHNSDPELLYTLLGSFIVILIGAFIGKWGHS